jgi:hypothetical protein
VTGPDYQAADIGNSLLAKVPTMLAVGVVETPDGQLAMLTFRTASTTFTALADATELKRWMDLQTGLYSTMSKGGLIVARGALPPISPNGLRP